MDFLQLDVGLRFVGFPPPPNRREPPLDVSAESTFDRWLALGPDDSRTIEEFAADPGGFTRCGDISVPRPPITGGTATWSGVGAYHTPIETGYLKASYPVLPPNHNVR